MDLQSAVSALAELTGGLQPSGGATDSHLRKAREIVARGLLLGQVEALFPPDDPFALAKGDEIDAGELAAIREICTRVDADIQSHPGVKLEFHVFRRSVSPTADFAEAAPQWAAGSVPTGTLGPFVNPDGRPFWFALYTTPRLVPLTRAGGGPPVLFLTLKDPLLPANTYAFPPGSIWIAAPALALGAPPDGYCGLRISGGSLHLDQVATIAAGGLVVTAGAVLQLDLKIDSPVQPSVPEANAIDPGGIQAQYPSKAKLVLSPGSADVNMDRAHLEIFGSAIDLERNPARPPLYLAAINRVLVPCKASVHRLDVAANTTLFKINGSADIRNSAWALQVARVTAPVTEAAGGGGIGLELDRGVAAQWLNLGSKVSLAELQIIVEPQGTSVIAAAPARSKAEQRFRLWKDRVFSERRCLLDLSYGPTFPVHFRIEADGSEALALAAFCTAHLDRPLSASGQRLRMRAANASAIFFTGAGAGASLLVRCSPAPGNLPFSLSNALLLAGLPASFFVFGSIDATGKTLDQGASALQMGVFAIVSILPDPYADNLLGRREQPRPIPRAAFRAQTRWTDPNAAPTMTFRLDPTLNTLPSLEELFPATLPAHAPEPRQINGDPSALQTDDVRLKALHDLFVGTIGSAPEKLLLLDVSSNADQFGVGFGPRPPTVSSADPQPSQTRIEGLSLVTLGRDLRVFTVPQVQWEPVWTIQNPDLAVFPSPLASADDGGPTLLGTNSVKLVPIAPRPLVTSLVSELKSGSQIFGAALFTLPFGMCAAAGPLGIPREAQARGAAFALVQPRSNDLDVVGGLQVSLTATDPNSTPQTESPSLKGFAIQTRNGVDPSTGARLALSVLSDKSLNVVESTFNTEFGPGGQAPRVPVTRIDFSGYGASLYSHWRNPNAQIAQTSEVRFDVSVGRTAHEVVQIRSILYPWAVRVVRTITIQRTGGGGLYRRDSGWVAASDGLFDFPPHSSGSKIETHPGLVRGVFAVRHIRDTSHAFDRTLAGPAGPTRVRLAAVRFDCEVRLSDVIVGGSDGLVTSVDQVGYIQLNPQGEPLTPAQYAELIASEGPLGGPVDCLLDVGHSGQRMRVTRVDVATAPKPPGLIEFAAAAHGSLLLPKDGQWSVCRQPTNNTLECEPLDPHTGVPLVREGRATIPEAANTAAYRFAEPADLLADTSGRNIGVLWSTGTQRLLFSRPRILKGARRITSDVAPLLADAFSKVSSGGLFPSALTCLRVPFTNYSLDVLGDSQLRLVLPSANFAAQPVSGNVRRELSLGPDARLLADYTNTRITLVLDSSAPTSFSYEETDVAVVQEQDGVLAKTSRGRFHASSSEKTRWTLEAEDFGPLFDKPKNIMPMFASSDLGGTLTGSGTTVPIDTTEEPEGPNPKAGLKIKIDLGDAKGTPMFIGTLDGGKIEIATDFQNFFGIEVVVSIVIAEVFPGAVYFKYQAEARKRTIPGTDVKQKVDSKEKLILAVGVYADGKYPIVGTPFQLTWDVFFGIGFTHDAIGGKKAVGLGIVFVVTGSVQYVVATRALAEVELKVEGQGIIEFRGGDQFIVLRGAISFEITIAFVIDIEWELAEGTVWEHRL